MSQANPLAEREAVHARSLADPDGFWMEAATRLDWMTPPTRAGDWSFAKDDFHIRWFDDGVLNVSANCIDRHLATRGDQVAILWEGDDPATEPRRITYAQLHREVGRFADVLKSLGAKKGDRITLYICLLYTSPSPRDS